MSCCFQENKLAILGGGTLKDSVRRVMTHLVTNSLSRLYNWEGRLGWKSVDSIQKRAFSGLLLTSVIISEFLIHEFVVAPIHQRPLNVHSLT